MWTRKAVVYVGLGTILVLFSPFINNLQLFLLGTTILGFVAVHSLVNTRPIDVKITRSFESDQVFENSDVTIDLIIQNKGRSVGFLEIYDNLPSEVEVNNGSNHTIIRLKKDELVVNKYHLECRLRGQYRLGNPSLRIYNPSFLFSSIFILFSSKFPYSRPITFLTYHYIGITFVVFQAGIIKRFVLFNESIF